MIVFSVGACAWLRSAHLIGRRVGLGPGSDMIVPLCEVARDLAAPVALVGSTDAVLRRAALALEREMPGLKICCRVAPTQGFDPDGPEAREVLAQLATSGARLCFLALGAPKQELFAANAREVMPDMGFVSIGAGLDFLAGAQKKAPGWVRGLALEWLWRMSAEPRKMGPRYLGCFGALPRLAVVALRSR